MAGFEAITEAAYCLHFVYYNFCSIVGQFEILPY